MEDTKQADDEKPLFPRTYRRLPGPSIATIFKKADSESGLESTPDVDSKLKGDDDGDEKPATFKDVRPNPPVQDMLLETAKIDATSASGDSALVNQVDGKSRTAPKNKEEVDLNNNPSEKGVKVESTRESFSNTSIAASGTGRSIEIFFGDFTDFGNFYQLVSEEDSSPGHRRNIRNTITRTKTGKTPVEESIAKCSTVNPLLVKKLCLIGHPLESFEGINSFKRLLEAWVTNCTIKELRQQDLLGLHHLQRLYAFGCSLESVEPLPLENLKILWLSGNRLTSLSFLNHGLPALQELNVANNEISCLSAESLFKCVSLENLNVAGNPLCTIQDIKDANACVKLRELTLVDAMYGKCPVACLCDSRPMIINTIKNVHVLNGKRVSEEEVQVTQEYVKHRCLYYYTNSVAAKSNHVILRNATVASVHKQLESIGERIINLLTFIAQTDYQLSTTPTFAKNKALVKEEMDKVHRRISDLRMWSIVTIERFETVIHINRWEQEVEEWIKWIEFQSYGSIQGYVAHSVLDLTLSQDVENIRATIHQLISGLSCSKPWPEDTILKVETIAVIRDIGAELGMEKTYGTYFSRNNEPKFVPPPPDPDPPYPAHLGLQQPYKYVSTYMDPDYKIPEPLFPFPESVAGLPERSHPCYMFLVCESGETNPILYLYKLLTDKTENFKEIRFTNCLWNAIEAIRFNEPEKPATASSDTNRPRSLGNFRLPRKNDVGANPFSVVVVMKVLEECLITVPTSNDKCRKTVITNYKHSYGCHIFGVSRPLSYAPAYIVSLSHSHNDRASIWVEGITDDSPVKAGVESLYRDALDPDVLSCGANKSQSRKNPYFLYKCGHGMKADLTAITKLIQNPFPLRGDTLEKEVLEHQQKAVSKLKACINLLRIPKFLGKEVAHTVTTLDLSGNGLGLTVGLEGMNHLRRLNLSHNNLTTLSGLHKLPRLIELKASWNYLRFLHSCISTLTWATPRLTSLEILPNPFQDVRDFAHIPLLVSQALPSLHRVDIWSTPFATTPRRTHNCFLTSCKFDTESKFSHAVLADSWVQGKSVSYKEFKGKCLTNLDNLPRSPPFPDGFSATAIELDLSDNYLSSTALGAANFVRTSEWRAAVVKLNLQENCITSLDWLKDNIFPNLHVLNLSNNHLQELDMIQFACPALIHLHLSGNPLPCNTYILAPLRHLLHLQSLEATRTPLSSHPDYANYVIRYISKIQVLDGTPVAHWRSEEIVNHMGGSLNSEWLEGNLGQRDWSALTELSLPHCGLSRVNLPSAAVPKLMSLDLTGNQLSTFSGITSLPNLRVLCVSYNSIKSLGPFPCPSCYAHTAESRAQYQRNRLSAGMGPIGSARLDKFKLSVHSFHKRSYFGKTDSKASSIDSSGFSAGYKDTPPFSPRSGLPKPEPPKIFPRLEVLIMSHNNLSGLGDLHLHCLPRLQTLLLNCNQITSFKGLDKLSSVQAIVLDHNQIKDIPFNTFVGCKCLKYLHLEHNRIASLPRLPHLNNLATLHLGYNRIQSLTDLNCLTTNGVKELTLAGNPASYRSDYSKNVLNQVGTLQKLDGADVSTHLTSLKGDITGLKFIVSAYQPKKKCKQKDSVVPVPHGNLKCRPVQVDAEIKQEEESSDQLTDILAAAE